MGVFYFHFTDGTKMPLGIVAEQGKLQKISGPIFFTSNFNGFHAAVFDKTDLDGNRWYMDGDTLYFQELGGSPQALNSGYYTGYYDGVQYQLYYKGWTHLGAKISLNSDTRKGYVSRLYVQNYRECLLGVEPMHKEYPILSRTGVNVVQPNSVINTLTDAALCYVDGLCTLSLGDLVQYENMVNIASLWNNGEIGQIAATNARTLMDVSGLHPIDFITGSNERLGEDRALYYAEKTPFYNIVAYPGSLTALNSVISKSWNSVGFDIPVFRNSIYEEDSGGGSYSDPYPVPQPEPTPPVSVGELDFHSDDVPVPSLPTLSAAETGFTRLYCPTISELQMLAAYMWTDDTFLQTLLNHVKQMIDDPMQYIIALNILPCYPDVVDAEEVKMLYIPTGVYMPRITNQFKRIDCGTYTVKRNYGSALDFAPNTKVSLYLPYIGVVALDVDEIMPTPPAESTTVGVVYTIDVLGGTCVAMVTVNGSVRYQFSGHCAIGIPFSAADFSTYQGALIQAAKTVLGVGATAAGATNLGAALLGAPVQKTSETATASGKVDDSGNFINDPKVTMRASSTKAQFGSLIANNISNTVSQVAASKPIVERSAGFSGNTGYMAVRRPYLLFESPRLVNPTEYGKYNGYPSMMYMSFANLSGFTQVQQIQLVGFSGTNPELDELQALLKSGVIF